MKLTSSSCNVAYHIYYNPTTSQFVYAVGTSSTWSSGGTLNTAFNLGAGAGTQNSGLAFGGQTPGSFYGCTTQEYNGSSWSSGGNLTLGVLCNSGAGTQNSALSMGGDTPSFGCCITQEYNGSSWAAGGAPPTCLTGGDGTGTQNSALHVGSRSFSCYCCTHEYNGSSWSIGGNTNCCQCCNAVGGTQNSAISLSGMSGSPSEEYNGTSWSVNAATPGSSFGWRGSGDNQNSFWATSMYPGISDTYCYNGTTFSLVSYLNPAWRAAAGNSSAALAAGGSEPGGVCTNTYELVSTPGTAEFCVKVCCNGTL